MTISTQHQPVRFGLFTADYLRQKRGQLLKFNPQFPADRLGLISDKIQAAEVTVPAKDPGMTEVLLSQLRSVGFKANMLAQRTLAEGQLLTGLIKQIWQDPNYVAPPSVEATVDAKIDEFLAAERRIFKGHQLPPNEQLAANVFVNAALN